MVRRAAKGVIDSIVLAQAHSESNPLEVEKLADMCVPPLVLGDVSSVPYLALKSKEKLYRCAVVSMVALPPAIVVQ